MEWLPFFRAFTRNPQEIGAVAPSSRFLAQTMVAAADIRPGHVVVELGAGTGPFTRAIRAAAPDVPLMALEPDPALAGLLRAELPSVEVVEGLAQDLPRLLEAWGHPKVDRVVSGLPWTIWPDDLRHAIFEAVLNTLTPEGRMVTFTYLQSPYLPHGRKLRRDLEQRFAEVNRTPTQWRNLPPAFVWVCDGPRPTA
ncbi:MAG: hypothetical protein JXX28_05320 [Deltaproteobacteria bacterium]|nr:hypothetical protein [Deltaproteobacteria bacterium]